MTNFTLTDEASRYQIVRYLETLSPEKTWLVSVKMKRKRRSLNQNALYHKWIDDARKEEALSGWTHDELDDALRAHCHAPRHKFADPFTGETRWRYSTSKSDSKEMAEYMERVYRLLAADYGVYLTLPEEQHAA